MAKILVVDDEEQIREMLVEMLALYGHQVETEPDGESALKRLDESFDLLITDIIMPKTTGFELIELVKNRLSTLPIIVMSGGGALNGNVRSLDKDDLGVVAILNKPFRGSELKILLDELLKNSGDSSSNEPAMCGGVDG